MEIEINNTSLKMNEDGSGETILLVHGSNSDYRTWDKQMEELAEKYHTITYSRRFHYPNTDIEDGQDYSMTQQLDDLHEVVKKIDNDTVHLVGHSYGGFLSILLSIRSPELITSLTLIEPPVFTLFISIPPSAFQILKLLFTRPRTAFAIIGFARKGLNPATKAAENGNMDKAFEVFARAVLGNKPFNNLSHDRYKQARENTFKAEILGSGFLDLNPDDIEMIKLPTLLVNGEKSPSIFHRFNDRLHELLPHSKQITLPNASHIVHEDNADQFNKELIAFLKAQE